MKKLALTLAGLLAFNVGIAAAAPLNELDTHQTAVGIMIHDSGPNTDTLYIEHKLSPQFTIGVQTDDIYGQIHLTDSLRAIIGNRNYGPDSKFYLGLGLTGPLSAQWDGFASLTAASEYKELHVGANYKVTHNVALTISYRSFMPDAGDNKNGIGFGASYKF